MSTTGLKRGLRVLTLFVALTLPPWPGAGKNGFDLSQASVPPNEIHRGGPPKDGIPAIDQPEFISASRARHMQNDGRVLGLHRNGIAKAYPIAILNWHEIVNDRVDGKPVAVTFCPLCGTGVAFSAEAAGKARSFGVSGLLYNSDVLLYDRDTQSLWSQLLGKAISGPLKGETLTLIPLRHTTWADWHTRHPDTLVLSRDTGYTRDYDRDPYASYVTSDGTLFPVKHRDPRYHAKERVIGIEIDGRAKAYPFAELSKTSGVVRDTFMGQELRIVYDQVHATGAIHDSQGNELPGITAFWFAWYAFHPQTKIFQIP